MIKKCTECKIEKSLENFYRDRRKETGYHVFCKDCRLSKTKRHLRTKLGFLRNVYNCQKSSSKVRGHNPPEYSFIELSDWVKSQSNFEKLWTNWVNSGYQKLMRPSVDRINDSIGYKFNNIQLMTWEENRNKAPTGKKPVRQIDNNNIVINIFESASQAQRVTGIRQAGISSAALGKSKSSGGYKWEFIENIKT